MLRAIEDGLSRSEADVPPVVTAMSSIPRAPRWPFDQGSADPPDLPVVAVSWCAAVMFCRWLARSPTFPGARLPREPEWERACRVRDVGAAASPTDRRRHIRRVAQLPPE